MNSHQMPIGRSLVVPAFLVLIVSGCVWQQSKTCCPIYPPRTYPGTTESIRVPPCGPDAYFHGMKKTQWCEWPAGWEMFPAKCVPCEDCYDPSLDDAPGTAEKVRLPSPEPLEVAPTNVDE